MVSSPSIVSLSEKKRTKKSNEKMKLAKVANIREFYTINCIYQSFIPI